MGELTAIKLCATPFHAGIGGTFQEIDPVFPWKTHQVLHGENQRRVDKSMDHQPVLTGVDLGNAAVVALETQAVRCDDPVKFMKRGKIDRRHRIRGQPWHIAPFDMGLERTWRAIGPGIDPLAQCLVPGFDLQNGRVTLCCDGGLGHDPCPGHSGPGGDPRFQKSAPRCRGIVHGWPPQLSVIEP